MATKNGYILEASGNTIPMIDSGSLRKEETAVHALDSNKLGGKTPEYYIQPQNLLDNSWWQRPKEIVNQRGLTSYNNTTGYTIDRWYVNDGTVEVVGNGVRISCQSVDWQATFLQYVETVDITKVYTFAIADSDGNVYLVHSVPGQRVEEQTSFGMIIAKCLPNVLPAFAVTVRSSNSGKTFVWAALYEGSYTAETLPPYVPKGYGVELFECMRYCRVYNIGEAVGTASSFDNIFYSDILLSPPMRIVPSLSGTGSMYITSPHFIGHTNSDTVIHSTSSRFSVCLKSSVDSVPNGTTGGVSNQFVVVLTADL